ncbi:MAG: serine hydrolase domain-containing protein, partial [Verrucomicrobiota bacterium]|nr:serine hydrolase domain-containing protein [Verrucomicrobiota bacterium]
MNSIFSAWFAIVFVLASTALGQALPTAEPREVGLSAGGISKIEPFVQRYIDERRLAGAVTIVAKSGKVVHFSTQGMQDIAAEKPMWKDTLFRIYSMTKAIASVAAMVLVEEGKLGLDDPVAKYIPAAGRMKFQGKSQSRQMTVRDLLRHTAGFSNNVTVDSAFRKAGLPPLHESTLEEIMNRLDAVPLRYQPGTDWHYSFGTEVLARVIEVASGQTLDVCIEEKVCKPLGMVDTAFFVPEEKRHRLAEIYGRNLQVVAAPQPGTRGAYTFDKLPKFLSAGGGLVSTATDYMRFCLMLSNNGVLDGDRFLKRETVEAMIRNQLPEGFGEIDRRPEGRGFGLGFAVRTRKIDTVPSSIGEYEWLGGAGTEYWLSPKDELVVITLTQQIPMIELGQEIKPIVY